MSAQHSFKRLVIEPTYACNLHCTHCYVYRSARAAGRMAHIRDSLPLSFWKRVLLSAPEDITVHFTGGELFEYPEMFGLLEYTSARFPFTLSTNGTHLDLQACQLLAALAPRQVTVSILGTEPIHDAITHVRGSYRKATSTIECLSRLLPAGRVYVNFVLLPENAHVVAQVVQRVEKLGAARMVIQLFDPALNRCGIVAGLEPLAPQSLDWSGVGLAKLAQILEAIQHRDSRNMPVLLASDMTPAEIVEYISGGFDINQWTCAEQFDTLRCSPAGRVYTCTGLEIGSMEQQGVIELWQSQAYTAFRQARMDAALENGCSGCCKIRRKG